MSATTASLLESLIRAMTPDEVARTAAARHRKEVEDWLTADLEIIRMRETGSWHHGTALDRFSDVDYFVTMRGSRPLASGAAIEALLSCCRAASTELWFRLIGHPFGCGTSMTVLTSRSRLPTTRTRTTTTFPTPMGVGGYAAIRQPT